MSYGEISSRTVLSSKIKFINIKWLYEHLKKAGVRSKSTVSLLMKVVCIAEEFEPNSIISMKLPLGSYKTSGYSRGPTSLLNQRFIFLA